MFFFFSERKRIKKILKSSSNSFDDFFDLFNIIYFYTSTLFILNFLEPYEEKTSYTFLGGYCLSISIPMGRLSNRCNSCSIAKRGKRSSESGVLSSNQESNLFQYSCYSIFPSTGRSTYRNGSGYFKKGRRFYATFPSSTNEIQLMK
uniref:Ribosomal protein S16 n=1 Tax=Sophora moorcroftiana TaxID=1323965 RepID=A0A8K1VDK8_9FABA|nr:ribosomal protein S16 [Sophora moorcroftiana]